MFPPAGARIYRNEAGEVTGWDSTYYDEPPYEPDDYLPSQDEDDDEDSDDEAS
jgi:hypothetical protein